MYWAMTDREGTVTDVLDSTGAMVQGRRFDAFGVQKQLTGPSAVPDPVSSMWGYTARQSDLVTGLQYNRARWYDPSNGRFLTEDPVGYAGGDANLYRYTFNNPL